MKSQMSELVGARQTRARDLGAPPGLVVVEGEPGRLAVVDDGALLGRAVVVGEDEGRVLEHLHRRGAVDVDRRLDLAVVAVAAPRLRTWKCSKCRVRTKFYLGRSTVSASRL